MLNLTHSLKHVVENLVELNVVESTVDVTQLLN